MITSFRCKETEALFRRLPVRKLPTDILQVARRKLLMLNAAEAIGDLRIPPGNRLEMLKGDRAGQWSIRINDQWRICFTWDGVGASDVEIIDYHS